MEPSPSVATLPVCVKYLTGNRSCGGYRLPVYFLDDLKGPLPITLRCVYCEHSFKERQELNLHYLAAHEEAFSEEELLMARSARANLELRLKRSPTSQGS